MKLRPTDEYFEDMGSCMFVSFSRDAEGNILGEPPEVCFASGYMQDDFDEKIWTHFVDGDFNFLFTGADPERFPEVRNPRH